MVKAQKKSIEISDEKLFLRFLQSGDREAVEAVIKRNQNSLLKFCAMQVGPSYSEDICQKTFSAMLNQKFIDNGSGSFRRWLFGIAANMCRMHFRTNARRRKRELGLSQWDENTEGNSIPARSFEQNDSLKTAWQEFSALPKDLRMALDLNVLQNFTCEEVGQILGVSRATANRMVQRAKEALKKRLVGLGISSLSVAGTVDLLRQHYNENPDEFSQTALDQILDAKEGPTGERNEAADGESEVITGGVASKVTLVFVFVAVAGAGVGMSSLLSPDTGNQSGKDSAVFVDTERSKPTNYLWDFKDPLPKGIDGIRKISGDWQWAVEDTKWNRKGLLYSTGETVFSFDLPESSDSTVVEFDLKIDPASKFHGGWLSKEDDVPRFGTQDLMRKRFIPEQSYTKLKMIFSGGRCYQVFEDEENFHFIGGYRTLEKRKPNDSICVLLSTFVVDKIQIRSAQPEEIDRAKQLAYEEEIGPDLPHTWDFNHINDKPGLYVYPGGSWPWKQDIGRGKGAENSSGGLRLNHQYVLAITKRLEKLPVVVELDMHVSPSQGSFTFEAGWLHRTSLESFKELRCLSIYSDQAVLNDSGWKRCKFYFFNDMIIQTIEGKVIDCSAVVWPGPGYEPQLRFDDSVIDNLSIRYADQKNIPEQVMKIKNKFNGATNAVGKPGN